jgi:hypothetical protein
MTTPLPQQLRKTDNERLANYKRNLDFYNGQQWPAGRDRRRDAKNLTFNYARAIVKKIAAYVMQGRSVNVEPASDDTTAIGAAAQAEAAIAGIHAVNHADRLDYDTEIDTAVLGDGAYKVTWSPERNAVRITAPDVQGLYAWPASDDLTEFVRVCQRYQLPADDPRVAPYARNDRPVELIEDWTTTLFDLYIDNQLASSVPNPYGFVPFVIFPNESQPKRWYGASDIDEIREPCLALNREVTRIDKILAVSGNPIAVLEGVQQSQDIAVDPGAVWEIPEGAKAYLLDLLRGGGVRLHIDYVDLLRNTLQDLAETPRTAFGDTDRDLSGVALRIQLQPLLQKVERKRLIRTAAYIRRTEMAFALLAQFRKEDHSQAGEIVVNWEPATPGDRTEAITNEAAMLTAGIAARRTAIARLGEVDDVDKELSLIDADDRDLSRRESSSTT